MFPLFLLPLLALGQDQPNALLWKVSGQGLARPSYVVGTMHSRDARAFNHVGEWLPVIEQVDAVAGELDLTDPGAEAMAMARGMLMPDGRSLADLYSGRKHKQVKQAVEGKLGPMAIMADRIKPFYLMAMLSEMGMRNDSALVLDQYLQEKAREAGKRVLGVETVKEQMAAVDDLPLQEQADMLYDMVRKDFHSKEMDRMIEAYARQDLAELAKLASMSGMSDGFSQRLLLQRNQVMATRVDSLMQEGGTYLFALGAAHLPGKQGVLDGLREMGYTVEPVLAEGRNGAR